MNNFFYGIGYIIQCSMVLAAELPQKNDLTSLPSSLSAPSLRFSSTISPDMGTDSDKSEDMIQELSPKQKMEEYLTSWEIDASSVIPSTLFDEVYESSDVNPLEKVGVMLFHSRLIKSFDLPFHQVAYYLGREFEFVHPVDDIEAIGICLASLVPVACGGFGGVILSSITQSFAIGFGVCGGIGCAGGIAIMAGCTAWHVNSGKWDISKAPIPLGNTTKEWVCENLEWHRHLYHQKVTDALDRDFNFLDTKALEILKTSFLDINGALPMTKITQNLPEEKKDSPLIDPQDIRKFEVGSEDGQLDIELYAYGRQSIENTKILVEYLNNQSSTLVLSIYNVLVSVADHKNFYAYTDSQNQEFQLTTSETSEVVFSEET